MNVSTVRKQPKTALIAAAVAVLLAGSAQAQDADRQNANGPPGAQSTTQVARSDAGIQTLEQYLQMKTLRASHLIGLQLQTRSGDNLGEVNDIANNAAPGQEMQLIVALGGVVGDDQKAVAIPFDEVQIAADGDELYTNRTRDQLASMPAVSLERSSEDAALANRDAANRGAAGAGESRSASPAGAGASASASLSDRRLGDLIGAAIVGADDDAVGEIEDIVLSTAGADSVLAVLQVGGLAGIGEKRISLPLRQLTVERTGDEPTVRVAMDTDALERLPEFEYEEQTEAL